MMLSSPEIMIAFHNINKKYRILGGHKIIFNKLNMTFPKRNIALLGANGVGKSTLLRMIAGAELPDKGRIKRHVNVSFPLGFSGSFSPSLSGMENTVFVARIYGQDTEQVVESVREFTELGNQLYSPVRTYSSGMRAKLAFGISLAVDFECYLVDEITAVGDQKFRVKSKNAFQKKLESANIIMVSHAMNTLREYCQSGIVLQDGNAFYFEDVEDAIKIHQEKMAS